MTNDTLFMTEALRLAQKAMANGEVPVGAVITFDNQIIASGYNEREKTLNPIDHAECIAIQAAAAKQRNWRLINCTLYVTLEPCLMCCGAIILARIPRIVFGALDPKAGAVKSLYTSLSDPRLNHRPEVISGVLEPECSKILRDFFKSRRLKDDLK